MEPGTGSVIARLPAPTRPFSSQYLDYPFFYHIPLSLPTRCCVFRQSSPGSYGLLPLGTLPRPPLPRNHPAVPRTLSLHPSRTTLAHLLHSVNGGLEHPTSRPARSMVSPLPTSAEFANVSTQPLLSLERPRPRQWPRPQVSARYLTWMHSVSWSLSLSLSASSGSTLRQEMAAPLSHSQHL